MLKYNYFIFLVILIERDVIFISFFTFQMALFLHMNKQSTTL